MGQSTGAYETPGEYTDYTPLASMGLGSYYNVLGSLGGYDSLSGYYSTLGSLGSLSSLGSLGSLGYYSSLGSYGSLSGLGSLSSLSSLTGLSSYSALGSLGSSYGGTNYNMLLALSSVLSDSMGVSGSGDTITMDRQSFTSLIELMRIQMMMNAEREVGFSSLL